MDLFSIARLWIVYTDGMTSVSIHKLHTRDIRITVPDIDHIPEWNPHLLRRKVIVYTLIIDIKNTLFNPKQKLRLTRIIDHLRRPYRHAACIIIERTCINFLKYTIFCDFRTFDHFL